MSEEWRPIEGYEGLYEVSSYGRVRSLDRYDSNNHFRKGKVLSPVKNKDGYLQVNLCCNGKYKMFLVHRLAAQAFIPNPDNLPEINHKDENPGNNNVDNLEWCTRKYNINYGSRKDKERDTKIKNGYWSGLSRKEYRKKWCQENTDNLKECRKKWCQENTDNLKEYKKKWYQENKDRICEQQKEYRRKKKEQIQNNVKSLDD